MVKLKKLGVFVLLVMCTACPEDRPLDGSMTIVNNSNENIISLGRMESMGDIESITNPKPWGQNPEQYLIPSGKKECELFSANSVQQSLERGWRKYYLFNYDSVATIPWSRRRDERIILKEVTFHSWEEMEACNFTITYPY
ncbi:MAG: hypothetical protein LBU62_00025 [Bacteroidales bacterium]|jgi:hypothetical protein|nr:hypothetical protein [Bacteroidales bacterium]